MLSIRTFSEYSESGSDRNGLSRFIDLSDSESDNKSLVSEKSKKYLSACKETKEFDQKISKTEEKVPWTTTFQHNCKSLVEELQTKNEPTFRNKDEFFESFNESFKAINTKVLQLYSESVNNYIHQQNEVNAAEDLKAANLIKNQQKSPTQNEVTSTEELRPANLTKSPPKSPKQKIKILSDIKISSRKQLLQLLSEENIIKNPIESSLSRYRNIGEALKAIIFDQMNVKEAARLFDVKYSTLYYHYSKKKREWIV